ncbi:GIY-YIG nuclease family protein [Micromonospora sp. C72]|uniref:GIY-YIG nuclease family protein n=1 Tax=Micromonospora sp. C72 TaxID=2824880 RepID=UPI001B374FC0|nr:GIY-YIG nuclease family protein [Micromonospora sp. C72]MBQ1041517.1 GIY-YIG nuclease family protein [Micromonospora sp. C72]
MVDRPTNDRTVRVTQKWGFGMAPVKPEVQQHRVRAASSLLRFLEGQQDEPDASFQEDLSLIKGLYSRCHRQDQWDWFTVWQQLGRPGRKHCQQAASALAGLRAAIGDGGGSSVASPVASFVQAGGQAHLAGLVTGKSPNPQGAGYIYVLSTREHPRFLKIGYTERSVEERVKEINRATGVLIPYGVRAVWVVAHARSVEAELHARLAPYRVRADREFFDLEFRDAFSLIRDCVYDSRRER